MKKSCSGKELKVITIKDVEGAVNDKEESLTEEQVLINKKLLESGVDSEGLGWLEKRNIFKTINVSLNSSGSEKSQRTSPRFSKTRSKWVENSFENSKKEDVQLNSEDENTPQPNKSEPENTNTPKSPVLLSSSGRKSQDNSVKLGNRREFLRDAELNGESPKSSKKVHYIKIQVEGDSAEECNNPAEDCPEEGKGVSVAKKRSSPPEIDAIDGAKKLKMDESNNEVPLENSNPLLVELEMERRKQNTPFNLRDIKIIVNECEFRNRKWKETFSKYHCPARWGIPIVKSCNDKWDGKRIPPKLLHRYQKYLSNNNLSHSVFFPKSQSGGDLNKLSCDLISSQSSTNSKYRDESENDLKDTSEGSFFEDDSKKSALENNLNASTSDSNARMVLRNRNQQRPVMVDERLEDEEGSSDDSDEWFSKQKPNKKQKINTKSKKVLNQNKQLVLKLEKCNINKKNGNEEGRKNGNDGFTGGSLMGNNQNEGISKPGPDPDTMVCPICSLRFKKQLIESHATECASKTYKD